MRAHKPTLAAKAHSQQVAKHVARAVTYTLEYVIPVKYKRRRTTTRH